MDAQDYPAQPPDQIDLSVLSSVEELARRKSDWDRLAATDKRDGMFRGYDWNVLWLKHMAPRVTPHVLEITRASGEVVGIAPLCQRTYKDSVFRFRSLGFTGREVTCGDFLDILAAPGYKDRVLSCVLEYLEQALRRQELIVIGECLQESDTAHKLSEWVGAKKLRARWQEERAAPYIELPSSFDEYRRTLSRNTRSNLRRRERQFLEEQGYTMERLRGPEEVLPQLPHLFRLHEARWRSLGQKGVFVHPGFCEFLHAFIEEAHPQTETVLYMMCADDEPMAAILLFRWGETTMYYQSGWDPASPGARLSPNLVLFGQAIGDAIAEGYRYFEFLRGDEPFKGKFTTTARPTTTLLVAGDGIKPCLYLVAMRIKDWAKSVMLNRLPAGRRSRTPLFRGGNVAEEEHRPGQRCVVGKDEEADS
jgi:CelD/BcsL family acetyltransferase involved in cellulose biosynthesis